MLFQPGLSHIVFRSIFPDPLRHARSTFNGVSALILAKAEVKVGAALSGVSAAAIHLT